MDNSIRNTAGPQTHIDKTQVNRQQKGQNTSVQNKPELKNDVEINQTQNMMKVMREKIDATKDVDMEKVNRIKAQLDSGNYSIDQKSVAQKLVEIESGLIKQD